MQTISLLKGTRGPREQLGEGPLSRQLISPPTLRSLAEGPGEAPRLTK